MVAAAANNIGGGSGGSGGFFSDLFGGLSGLATAASTAFGTWTDIRTKKQALQLQQAQVNAEIAKLKAQARLAQQAASAPAPQPVAAVSAAPRGGFSLGSIPPWLLVAGAAAAFFALRGAVVR